jgi:quercetin dioxygenase-like cupin family protein
MRIRNDRKSLTVVALGLLACAGASAQQLPEGVVIFDPAKATWAPSATPGSPAGLEQVIIYGHPTKAGPYLVQTKFPPNFVAQAHTHPDNRFGTVISGTWYVGFGDKFDESKLIPLAPGSSYTEPTDVAHFLATKGASAIVQFSGTGPSRVIWADPAQVPAKK